MSIYSQLQTDAQWHSVVFWLRKLNSVKTCYETHDQELLTIMKVFKHWQHYLKNSHYFIKMLINHNNLQRFMNVKQLNDRQAHWTIKLAVYNFNIIYKLRKTNSVNALSRCSDYKVSENINRLLSILQRKLTAIF